MSPQLYTETHYYFDLSSKQWWILPRTGEEWEELSNEEAYRLGLFNSVSAEKCNFLDTDLSQYTSAVSDLLKDLDNKVNANNNEPISKCSVTQEQCVNKLLSKDFMVENVEKPKKTVTYSEDELCQEIKSADLETNVDSTPKISRQITKVQQTTTSSENKDSNELLGRINNLIESTSQMKQKCKEKELAAQNSANSPTVRRTARHLTYVDHGGLSGCLKTMAEERKKMGSKKQLVPEPQNSQLKEMIQRAKEIAVKTMEDVKAAESEAAAKKEAEAKAKKTQQRRNTRKYTMVFRPDDLKNSKLRQLPEVQFEVSSEEDSDEDQEDGNQQSIFRTRTLTQKVQKRSTMGR